MNSITKVPRESRWCTHLTAALAVVAALVAAPQAHAFGGFLTAWQNAYGASTTDQTSGRNGCQVCHSDSNNQRNTYGRDIEALIDGGTPIDTAITNVEDLDSDGNGDSNLTEINANSQPGWTPAPPDNPLFNNGAQVATVNPATIGVQPPLDPVVGNQPPVAVNDAYSTAFETQLTVAAPGVLVNDSDADNDPITAVLQVGPANGTLVGGLNADGSFTYTPIAGFSGDDTFTYVANDGTDNSNIATVTITVAAAGNQPPVAVDDLFSTPFQTQLIVPAPGVLGNDTDADNNPLTAALVTGVSNGVLNLSADGSFTYSPNATFSGQDGFTYVANDGNVNSNSATVTITVGAAPPPPPAPECTGLTIDSATYSVQGNPNNPNIRLRVRGSGARDTEYVLANAFDLGQVFGTARGNRNFNFNERGPFDPVPCRVQVFQESSGLCAQADVVGAPGNCAPVGITPRGDSYTTPRDEILTVPATRLSGLLYNDFDQGSPASLLSVVNVDTTGTQGSVAVNPDGSFSYTPPAGAPSAGAAYLDDTFTYQTTTGTRTSLAATVNVRTLPKQTDFKFMMNYELGMHCTGFEFAYCCVLPAYNSIVSQIVKPAIGDPSLDFSAEAQFVDGFPRLLEGDPNLGANLDVLGRETVVRDPALNANGDFKKYVVKYWHDAQSRNDGQGKPQIGNPALQDTLPPYLNTRSLISDVEFNSLLSWNTRADAADRNPDGTFVIGPAECDPNLPVPDGCAALGVVQGDGDFGTVGNFPLANTPVDNYQNAVWNHLYIYSGTEGAQLCAADTSVACFSDADCAGVGGSCGVTTDINKTRLGLDVAYPTNFGPAGHPMGPVSGGTFFEDNPFGAHLTFSEDTGTVVYTQMKLVENLPIMLTSPRIWEALGLPLTTFEDTLGFFADPGLVDEDSIRPYVQMSAQLHHAVCDETTGDCTAGAAVLGEGGHPVQGFGDAPIDIPNCERCHSAPPTDAFGNLNVNSPNVDPENNVLVELETDFWMAYYDLDPAAGDSDWYARLKGAAISILAIHDAQHGTRFTGNFPAVQPIQPAGTPFDPVTQLGGLSEPFVNSPANCLVNKAPTGPACASHADCASIGDEVCDLPQNTRIGHESVICQKCHGDNVIAVVKSTNCGPNAQSCPEGGLIPALSQALHYNHRSISEGGFVTFGDALGRDGGCQGCHPAHRSDGVMDGYPITLDGDNFQALGDNRLASGGCFVGRDVHSNPMKDIDGAETPEHLNVLGQYLADNVFNNQAAEPGGTEDTRGVWCTNCHSQAGQQMWKAENCKDLINNDCESDAENPRAATTMQELADLIVTRQPDPALRLAQLESWADPVDPAVNPDLPLSGAGTRTADDTHFIWAINNAAEGGTGLCNYVAQWAAAGFNLSEISAQYDGPAALVEVAVPALGGSVGACQTADALSDAPGGTPVAICDGAPGIPPGGFFICGSYDADGDFTAALTAPPGESPFCTTQDCKTAADATLSGGGTAGNVTAQIPFSTSDITTASDGRDHWLSAGEPHCADCHKAPYTEQSGNINAFPPFNYPRRASLMRYSRGHQDVTCQGCHESIHGLYPVTPTIDNTSYAQAAALNNDGSHGPLKCESCHTHVNADQVPTWVEGLSYTDPVDGGPAVPVVNDFDAAVSWAHTYTDEADPRASVCLNCHEDESGEISDSETEWLIHAMVNRVSRVAMDDAEIAQNGAVSGSTDGSDGVCLGCHGDESEELQDDGCDVDEGEWKRHLTEGRVAESVWEDVSIALTGTTCGW